MVPSNAPDDGSSRYSHCRPLTASIRSTRRPSPATTSTTRAPGGRARSVSPKDEAAPRGRVADPFDDAIGDQRQTGDDQDGHGDDQEFERSHRAAPQGAALHMGNTPFRIDFVPRASSIDR